MATKHSNATRRNTGDTTSFSTDDLGDVIEKLEQAQAILTLMVSAYGPAGEGHSEVQRSAEAVYQIVRDAEAIICERGKGVAHG